MIPEVFGLEIVEINDRSFWFYLGCVNMVVVVALKIDVLILTGCD